MDSVVFRRDMEVGRQEGHQLPTETDLTRLETNKQTIEEKGMIRMIKQRHRGGNQT